MSLTPEQIEGGVMGEPMTGARAWLFAPCNSRFDTLFLILAVHYLLLGSWKTALALVVIGGVIYGFAEAFARTAAKDR